MAAAGRQPFNQLFLSDANSSLCPPPRPTTILFFPGQLLIGVFKCFWQTSFGTPTACAPPRLIGPRYCSLASYYSKPLLVGPVKRVLSFSWQPMVGNWATKGGQLGNLWWSIGQPRVGYWAIFGKLPVNRQQSAHCHTVPRWALGTIWWAPFILFGGLSVSSFLSILICTYPFTNS